MLKNLCYNLQEGFLLKKTYLIDDLGEKINELEDALLSPAIIHFSGSLKPWMFGCRNPYRALFKKYQNQTPWKGVDISKESYVKLCKRIIRSYAKRFLMKIGVLQNLEDKEMRYFLIRKYQRCN